MSTDTSVITTIHCDDVKQALLAVVETNPYRVDPRTVDEIRPRYLGHDGKPNSLVAHILLRLGLDENVLRQLDYEFPLGELLSSGVRISESRNPALARFEDKALALLDYLQDCQDGGLPWADCYLDAYAKPSRLIPVKYVRERRPWLF